MENAQRKKIAGAAVIVMSALVISRITGFLRSTLVPNMIAEAWKMEAFNLSFRITDFMFNLLVGGAIAAALIPVLSGYLAKDEEEDGWKAVGTFINITFISMVAVSVLGIIFAPQIVGAMAPRFDERTRALAVTLTRILFPSVAFLMLAGMTNGVLNSYQRFAAAAYGPSLYNIGSALSILLLSRFGVETAVFGIACSAAVYFFFQLSFALKNLKYYRFKIYLGHQGFKRLFKLAVPSLVSSSVMQVNVLISSFFTVLFSGGINAYTMANDVWQMPFGIFAVGMGAAILPSLSEKLALGQVEDYKEILLKGIKSVIFFTVPSAIAFVVLGKPIIAAIYKWTARFDLSLIDNTGNILMVFSIAVIAHSMLAIINRAFYANNDTKTPLYVGIGAVLQTVVLNYIFTRVTSLGPAGMALSYSITGIVNLSILTYILNRRMKGIGLKRLLIFVSKVFFAAAIMGMVLYFGDMLVPVDIYAPFSSSLKMRELAWLLGEVVAGVAVYFGVVMLMGLEEARYMLRLIQGKAERVFPAIKKFLSR
ncbi:putative peptidoglycan lipid II flippase [Anaerobacterium chartisolvens]|uniref:Probable lipid II flippase MurJ n=1 Tax=Anaerobacterium chartisolvens TaxID=1297424 RepID=A0A369BF00_9FIRM|nr:murein biosynthesis integral membrane protein MurJ [Anaerobacterium chartisolvens]RCX20001.1 putative peptidoglycan lipid II flippase [Anaerobacterium chartisolvens]